MPLANGELTRSEQAFIKRFAECGDRETAERYAGIAVGSGYQVLARPEIQRQIALQHLARLTNDALPVAVDVLIRCMESDAAPWSARVAAAKVVIGETKPAETSGSDKPLAEMTAEELAAAIDVLESRKSALAQDVTPASGSSDLFD